MIVLDISLADFTLFSYLWITLAIIVFILLFFVTAPYGRHSKSTWGPMISNRVGWVIMELPVLTVLFILIIPFAQSIPFVAWVIAALFSLHYLNRIFIFPFRLNTKGKKMPLAIVLSAISFNLVNGFLIGYFLVHFANYPANWFNDARFIFGTLLFFTGMYINWKADNMLIHLRKPGETHYVIPRTWLFDTISCPNLFGELIEWLGFAILSWNLPALCFFIWTAANLIPRAVSHHKWYKEKFPGYPSTRKAIIPFIV